MWKDVFFEIGVGVCIIMAAIGALLVGVNKYEAYQCSQYEVMTGTETKYSPYDSCYVKTVGGWNQWEEYITRKSAESGLEQLKPVVR